MKDEAQRAYEYLQKSAPNWRGIFIALGFVLVGAFLLLIVFGARIF